VKLSERLAAILCNVDGKRDPRAGICCQDSVFNDGLLEGIRDWIKSTGANPVEKCYPISGGRDAYYEAARTGSMWLGEYGQERKALLRHLIRFYRARGE
jgi:hypothetical protein